MPTVATTIVSPVAATSRARARVRCRLFIRKEARAALARASDQSISTWRDASSSLRARSVTGQLSLDDGLRCRDVALRRRERAAARLCDSIEPVPLHGAQHPRDAMVGGESIEDDV